VDPGCGFGDVVPSQKTGLKDPSFIDFERNNTRDVRYGKNA
jgi:hypothetical protein